MSGTDRQRYIAQQRIEALEVKQLRAMRELFIDPMNEDARMRLAEIDTRIAALREAL